MNYFKGRSLCVIDDFSKEERLYLFEKVRELKKAIADGDTAKRDSFRINDWSFLSVYMRSFLKTVQEPRRVFVMLRSSIM